MKALACVGLLAILSAAQAQTATAHAPDGGVRQTLQSIAVFPLTNSPFTAVVTTEWTKILPDGNQATTGNRRTIARDSSGRIFEERRYLAPNGDSQPTRISNLQYMDPNRHEMYDCIPDQKVCYVSTYRRAALSKMPDNIGGAQVSGFGGPEGSGSAVKQEALGQKTIESVEVIGSREIVTLPAGRFGNDRPEPVVKEFWYSPRLGLNLVTKRFDPRTGIQNFAVDHVSLSEPDTRMFQPPSDYQVVRAAGPVGTR